MILQSVASIWTVDRIQVVARANHEHAKLESRIRLEALVPFFLRTICRRMVLKYIVGIVYRSKYYYYPIISKR